MSEREAVQISQEVGRAHEKEMEPVVVEEIPPVRVSVEKAAEDLLRRRMIAPEQMVSMADQILATVIGEVETFHPIGVHPVLVTVEIPTIRMAQAIHPNVKAIAVRLPVEMKVVPDQNRENAFVWVE